MVVSISRLVPVLVLLPFVFCVGLLAVVVLCERSRGFAQFVKYGANGVIATYVQLGLFYALAATCIRCLAPDDLAVLYLGFPSVEVSNGSRALRFVVSTSVGFTVANVVCWLMNRWCVFLPGKFKWYVEFGMFFATSLIAMAIAMGLSWALIHIAGLMTSMAAAVEVIVSFFVNFFVRKFIIFKG